MNKTKVIHGVDDDQWRKFVGVAKYKDMKAGELLNEVIFIFLEKHKIRDKNDNLI